MKDQELVNKGIEFYYRLKNKDKALQCFNEAIIANGNNIKAHVNKANILIDSGCFHEGLKFIEKAISINRHYVNSYFVKSKGIAKLSDIKEATNLYKFAANFYINYERDAESYFLQGEALELIRENTIYLEGEEEQTQKDIITCFSIALKIERNFAAVYKAKSEALINAEQFEDAFKCCQEALKFKEYRSELYSDMGRCLYALQNYNESLLYFDTAIELAPKEAKYNYYQGLCLNRLGRYKDAKISFDKFVDLKSKEQSLPDEEEIAILCSLTEEKEFAVQWINFENGNVIETDAAGKIESGNEEQ